MKTIAITGGPCAGKTSAMDVLRERFERVGFSAVFIPEAATDLINSGIAPWTCASMLEFQTQVIALQIEREAAAADSGAEVVICDRGLCDSHAYLTDEDYARALAANAVTEKQALARYDAVFHLQSIAKDDPGAYTQDNNGARFENAQEAALANDRVIRAWEGHSAFKVIGNYPSFNEKAATLWEAIAAFLGVTTA